MRAAAGPEELVADPAGRFVTGRTFVYFWADPTLCGFAIWGRPDEADMQRLIRLLRTELVPPAVPHASLVDARRLEGVDAGAYAAIADYVRENHEALGRHVTRLALVRPAGLAGAVVAGFFSVLEAPYPVGHFAGVAGALEWLGHGARAGLPAELDALQLAASGTAPVIAELRGVIDADLPGASLESAARVMGLSDRTLQRRLQEAGTTFHQELNLAQVRVAKAMLLDSDAQLTRVALDVGCASLSHFSALFRKLTGESPSAWRAKQRRQPRAGGSGSDT